MSDVCSLVGDLSKLKAVPIEVKEGTQSRMKVMFRVQREIVSGLRYKQLTYRKGIRGTHTRLSVHVWIAEKW